MKEKHNKMGKRSKKRKCSPNNQNSSNAPTEKRKDLNPSKSKSKGGNVFNPLFDSHSSFLNSLPSKVRNNFFSVTHVDPDTRAEIWQNQADIGERLVNKYSWATPDVRALKILKHFGPIVEIGSGANGYWSNLMQNSGIDVIAYDAHLKDGGKISHQKMTQRSNEKSKIDGEKDGSTSTNKLVVRKGGPSVLSSKKNVNGKGSIFCSKTASYNPFKEFSNFMRFMCTSHEKSNPIFVLS